MVAIYASAQCWSHPLRGLGRLVAPVAANRAGFVREPDHSRVEFDEDGLRPRQKTARFATEPMADTTDKTQSRRIRIPPEQWARVETAASGTTQTPNDLLVQLAMEALDQRDLFGKDARVRVARASLFAAQVLARSLIAEGREHEIQEIREFISTIIADPDKV